MYIIFLLVLEKKVNIVVLFIKIEYFLLFKDIKLFIE